MSEYDLVCERCGETATVEDAIVSWTRDSEMEGDHALTHKRCEPSGATDWLPVSRLVAPQEFLLFVGRRIGVPVREPERLRTIVFAIAPFLLRPANGVEMNVLRAATFGKVFGIDPFKSPEVGSRSR